MTRKLLLEKIAREKQTGTFKGFFHSKQLDIKAITGVEITPEILGKINQFTLEPHTAEQLYVRKFLLAHNCVDRDRERFPEALLDDFADTIRSKSQLIGHSRGGPGKGLFFDASTEEMTPEQFQSLTGEEPKLGEGITSVKVLWAWMYMLHYDVDETNKETILNINAGIYRHVSIGFRASDLVAVKGKYEETLYWEYVPPGEALEGSIVWLGAQPGATAQKGAEDDDEETQSAGPKAPGDNKGGLQKMKELLAILAMLFNKSFTEEGLGAQIKEAFDALMQKMRKDLDEAKAALQAKTDEVVAMQKKLDDLTPLADEGKAFRADLCEKYALARKKLGDIDDKPETFETAKKTSAGFGIDFLKSELQVLERRVAEKFPAEASFKGEDPNKDKSNPNGKKKNPLDFDDEG